jgi:hypothetical protein
MPKITCTPINLNKPTGRGILAKRDYIKEMPKFINEHDEHPHWDDTCKNNSEIGDKFGFIHNIANRVEIFEIINILPITSRKDWWIIPEHQRRRVLVLSNKQGEISFTDYKRICGYKDNWKSQGTQRNKWYSNLI